MLVQVLIEGGQNFRVEGDGCSGEGTRIGEVGSSERCKVEGGGARLHGELQSCPEPGRSGIVGESCNVVVTRDVPDLDQRERHRVRVRVNIQHITRNLAEGPGITKSGNVFE